jgi:glycosyltransferase involved in cell wall biosynthesis/peptidoglycan/xylan/chitin deacetylase (PgdA/CDA1 family)
VAPLLTALWRGLAYASQWTGVGPMVARARRRPGTWTVLTYHRVGTMTDDAVHTGPDFVSPERFRAQVRWLRQRYDVLPVGEAFVRLQGAPPPARPIASITFDDGYRDNVDAALPILLQEGCRATLYATVEAVREGLPPWTHRLACDLAALARRPPAPEGGPLHPLIEACLRAGSGGDTAEAIRRAVNRAKDRPDAERARIVEAADRLSGGVGRRAAPMIGAEGLRAWRDAGMEIGSHTLCHRVLARLPRDERRRDLAQSRADLEALAGAPVVHLAYPNGGAGDWDADTRDDAAAAGYSTAMTTIEGINGAGLDPLALRRVAGAEDPMPVFTARVSGLWSAPRRWLKGGRGGRAPGPVAPAPSGIRIAFIGGRGVGSAYSGIERYYEEIGSRLVARGHTVVAYSRAHFTPDVATYRGVQVRRMPTLKLKHLETLVHSVLATLDVTFRPVDLVQYHALGSSPLAWVPRLAGKRTIVSVRGLDWQRAKWGAIARWYLKFCETTSVFCPNATAVVSRTLERHYALRHGARVRYIPNGVERRETCPPDAIRTFGLGERDYFLYAGRLSPEKGLECLIEAHQRAGGATRLAIAGGSSYSDRYIEQLRGLAGERVVFTGFQTGRSLQELYSNALAFVLPSHMEGLSVALLEALSYGLPVIASDIPENRELVDACGGYVFPTDDVAALARILARVAADPVAARRLGDACRERVRARFDWDWVAECTERFYLEVLDRSGRATEEARMPEGTDGAGEPRMEKKVGVP